MSARALSINKRYPHAIVAGDYLLAKRIVIALLDPIGMNACSLLITLAVSAYALFSAEQVAAQAVISDFTGPYALTNWSGGANGGGGPWGIATTELLTNSIPTSVTFVASSTGEEAKIEMIIDAVADGIWLFDWQYNGLAPNVSSPTAGGILLNGVFLSLASGQASVSGSFSTNVLQGNAIGFRLFASGLGSPSITNVASMTITKFTAPVPEPSTYALLTMSAFGALLWATRRK